MENAYQALPIIFGGYESILSLSSSSQIRVLNMLQFNIPTTELVYAYSLSDDKWNILVAYLNILIQGGSVDTDTISSLTESQCRQLLLPKVKDLVETSVLSFKEAYTLPLTASKIDVLDAYHDILIQGGSVDTDTISSLTESQCRQLLIPKVKDLVETSVLSFKEDYTLPLTASKINVLEAYSTELINSNHISADTIMGLTDSKRRQLLLPAVKRLVQDSTIPFELAVRSHEGEIEHVLINHQIISMFPAHRNHVDLRDLRDLQHTHFGQRMLERETTHRASVHITASQSATRLEKGYQHKIGSSLKDLESDIIEFYIRELDKMGLDFREIDYTKHKHPTAVALRGLQRLQHPQFEHTDPVSNISITKLLALAYEAICDGRTRIATFRGGLKALINGLYDIQRGKNFDNPREIDDGDPQDKYVCLPGTFNKIIEALCGVHPDAQQNYVTMELASKKLPIIVKEEAQAYLNTMALQLGSFSTLLEAIRQEGVETIYPQIRPKVEQRVCDEFMILFTNRPQELKAFVDNGEYTDIKDVVNTFHEENASNLQSHYTPARLL
jgi:hypothetical protein